jgi:hypothetical protein
MKDICDRHSRLNQRLKANRCVDWGWDSLLSGIPVIRHIDIPLLAKQLSALAEYLGLEWQVETTKAGFQEKVEETE